MKRTEDEKIEWEISKYKRFLGPEELKEFSIKINEKEFNEKVFQNKLEYNLHDLTYYNELDLNTALNSIIILRDAFFKKIDEEKIEFIDKLKYSNYFIKMLLSIGSKEMQKIFFDNMDIKFRKKYQKELEFFENSIRKIEDKIELKIINVFKFELC